MREAEEKASEKAREEEMDKIHALIKMAGGTINFDEDTHKYTVAGREHISCTQLLEKMGISRSYKNIADLPSVIAAREKGIRVHKEISEWYNSVNHDEKFWNSANIMKNYTQEAMLAIAWMEHGKHLGYNENLFSEQKVCNTEYRIAGTFDLGWSEYYKDTDRENGWGVAPDNDTYIIADVKTSRHPDLEEAAWQLALYRYMLAPFFPKRQKFMLAVIYFDYDYIKNYDWKKAGAPLSESGGVVLTDVSNIVKPENVEALLKAYKNGEPFDSSVCLVSLEERLLAMDAAKITTKIKAAEDTVKALKFDLERCKADIYDVMFKNKVESLTVKDPASNTEISLKRVDAFFRRVLDTKRIKEEVPEVYEEYSKSSEVGETVRITVKELKDEKNTIESSDAGKLE